MKFIVLLTDFGYRDPYVGVMKGVIKSINPYIEIIDLTHGINRQNVYEAAITLYVSAKYFPKNTIFVCVVDPGVGSRRKALLIETNNYYLIGPDNGCLTLLARRDGYRKIYDISNSSFLPKNRSYTFHGRDVFAPMAAYLSLGYKPSELGIEVSDKDIVWLRFTEPIVRDNNIYGSVIYIDVFGNIMTNIDKKLLEKINIKPHDHVEIILGGNQAKCRFVESFSQVALREYACYINSWGFFEIAINQGNAAESLNVSEGDTVIVSKTG